MSTYNRKSVPSRREEKRLQKQGFCVIAGVDEVGVGCLAGPVVAAAVVLPRGFRAMGVMDSKQMTERARERAAVRIWKSALAVSVGEATVEEIGEWNIRGAGLLACQRAIAQIPADAILMDAWTIPNIAVFQKGIVRGDASVLSIAAASVVAKVYRDHLMEAWHSVFPEYGFADHVGYATPKHQEAIHTHGPCTLHRLSWNVFRHKFQLTI